MEIVWLLTFSPITHFAGDHVGRPHILMPILIKFTLPPIAWRWLYDSLLDLLILYLKKGRTPCALPWFETFLF